jgi:hypothetical protein
VDHVGRRPPVGGQSQRGDHHVGDGGRVLHRSQLDHARAQVGRLRGPVRHLERQPRLAHAAGTGQRDQAGVAQQVDDQLPVVVAADERRRHDRRREAW